MASSIDNIKRGAAKVSFNSVDMGWTKGAVKVKMSESAKAITIDQFGEQIMDEVITGKDLKITIPLAETAIVAVMPYVFSEYSVSTTAVYLGLDVGTSRMSNAYSLTIELMTSETAVEAGNTPNKYYFYKAVPCGPLEDSYQVGEQAVYDVEFHVYPDSSNSYRLGYRGKV